MCTEMFQSVLNLLKHFSTHRQTRNRFISLLTIMSFYVKGSVFLESFSFINNCVKECDFLVWNSAVHLLLDEHCLLIQEINLFLVCRCPIEMSRHR